jgi:hypothetical protein
MIIQDTETLRQQGTQIVTHWIPANQEIQGNKAADKAANEATEWRLEKNARGRTVQVDTDTTAEAGRPEATAIRSQRQLKAQAYEQWE